jgi:hypothetical protein
LNDIDVSNPALGLNIYKNAINKEDISWIIDTLEDNLVFWTQSIHGRKHR